MRNNRDEMKYRILVWLAVVFIYADAYGQRRNEVVQAPDSDSLEMFSRIIWNGANDYVRLEANENFKRKLLDVIRREGSINWAFDSVPALSVMGDKNLKFRIYTWMVPLTNDKYEHFGIISIFNNKSGQYKITELVDVKKEHPDIERLVLKGSNWYGATYYQIIETKYQGEQVYTLLGYDGNNELSQKKVVEILTINQRDEPVWGKLIFRGYGKNSKRAIFEYSDQAVMKVKYEEKTYIVVTRKVKKKKPRRGQQMNNDDAIQADKKVIKVKTKHAMIIVFDRLQPLRPELEGQFQFYVPEVNVIDGFVFENGKWKIIKDIQQPKPDLMPLKDPAQGLLPN